MWATSISLFLANLIGVGLSYYTHRFTSGEFMQSTLFIATVWNTYNLLFLGSVLYFLTRYNLSKQTSARFIVGQRVALLNGEESILQRVSLSGALVHTRKRLPRHGILQIGGAHIPWRRTGYERSNTGFTSTIAFSNTMSYATQSVLLGFILGSLHESFLAPETVEPRLEPSVHLGFTSLL